MRDFMLARRFSPPAFRIFVLAILVAAGLSTPFFVAAQTTAPAAQPAASQTSEADRSEAAKSEADANDVYLHSPKVKKLAEMLHLDVKTTARISLGINFIVIVLGLSFVIFRWMPDYWLPSVLRNRSEKLHTDLESARKVSEDAYARLSAIEAKLSGLDGEIAQIRSQVELESQQDEAHIKSTIKEESVRIVAAAAQEMEATVAQARRSLRHFAADLAIEQAVEHLAITPETDRALIAEFLGDASLTGATGKDKAKGGRK